MTIRSISEELIDLKLLDSSSPNKRGEQETVGGSSSLLEAKPEEGHKMKIMKDGLEVPPTLDKSNNSNNNKEEEPRAPPPSDPSLMTVQDYLNQEVKEADLRIHYGDDSEQFGDLFLPKIPTSRSSITSTCSSRPPFLLPVIVFLHGGCWDPRFDLQPVSGLCRALADKCRAAVWNLEYRRWGNGGGWPHTYIDAAKGLDMLQGEMAQEFSLDLNNIVVAGHSAGGQLALWLAARPTLAKDFSLYENVQPLAIKSVVALAPVCDIERANEAGACGNTVSQLMGGPSQKVSDCYKAGSPIALCPLGVRHIIITGMQDKVVPMGSLVPFIDKAHELGDDASIIPINNAGHFELVAPHTMAGQMVMEAIEGEVEHNNMTMGDSSRMSFSMSSRMNYSSSRRTDYSSRRRSTTLFEI